MPTLTFAEYLRVRPMYTDSTEIGGCSFVAHLQHAAAAIQAGLCWVALVAYGSTQRSDAGKLVRMAERSPYEQPYGMMHPTNRSASSPSGTWRSTGRPASSSQSSPSPHDSGPCSPKTPTFDCR